MTSLNKSPPVWGMQTTALMKNNVNSSRNGDASDKDIDKVDVRVVEKKALIWSVKNKNKSILRSLR